MEPNTIVITGASSGIGAALAVRLARPGRTLTLIGRHEARLEEVAAACRSKGTSSRSACIDIRSAAHLTAFLQEVDGVTPIDLLICNAGILDGRHEDQVVETGSTAQRVLETNLLAAVNTIH